MIDQEAENVDFYENFLNFLSKAKDHTNVRFNYMRELYNLGVDSFPDDVEVCNIQQNNKVNVQATQNKLKKNWTDDDRKVLIWLVGKFAAMYRKDFKQINDSEWVLIASMMPRRDSFKCKQKWLQMMKLPLQQAPWTATEDDLLKQIILDFQNQNKGNKWSQIATTLNRISDSNVHRNGKQCRERWNNHLNPTINRNPWQLEEDLDLMNMSITNGKKWALISKKLQVPRSENSVKNRFNCLLRKERAQKNEKVQDEQISDESKSSNFPSAEELTHDEMKLIHAIIKKIEWRIQQSGNHKDSEDNLIKEEHDDLRKQVKVEQNLQSNKKEIKYKKILSTDNISLIVKESSQLTEEEFNGLIPCLVNKEKNQIIFPSFEQLQTFINKSEPTQLTPQECNLSHQNSAYIYDPKLLRQMIAYSQQQQEYQTAQFLNQRSIINNLPNLQSMGSYPYSMSCYPSQLNLMR